MSFLSSIFLLAALVSGVLIPILVGHGLAAHDTGAILAGAVAGAVSAFFMLLYSRVAPRSGGSSGPSH